jgi:chitodextrinase
MTTMKISARRLAWPTMAFVLLATGALAAPTDRKAPTAPRNLRVTAMTAYTVSLAWEPSTDNSGRVRYQICCANAGSQWVEGPASSAVYRSGLEANRTFTLRIWAVDPSGNWSQPSNAVTFTTLADNVPPTTPLVSVTDVGATHVALMWSSMEEGPVWFTLFRDGAPLGSMTRDTTTIVPLLEPQTTHTFTVRAWDFRGNHSPLSAPVTATTDPANPDDVTAPTTPSAWFGYVAGCEVQVMWAESTDDFDPQFVIEYEIYLNGVHVDSTALRFTNIVVYANRGGVNTFAVAAVDSAGNRSLLSNELSDSFDGCSF